MAGKPILILQLRRLGDVLLTLPLWHDLKKKFPDNPIWIVTQPYLQKELPQLFPDIIFHGPDALRQLAGMEFEAVINLGGDDQSSLFTAMAKASRKLGKLKYGDSLFVRGFWQLYRESLTCNNRHNLFHWADLFRMDLGLPLVGAPPQIETRTASKRIGLFIGASHADKHPDAQFWSQLGKALAERDFKIILMGGPSEQLLGKSIMDLGTPAVNHCGKTSIKQLASLIKTVDMLLTPDTGPMHLAAILRTPILNLSMGNVNACETGPYGLGHHICRAAMSCSGCWQCSRNAPTCKGRFNPELIANLAASLHNGDNTPGIAGLELLKCGSNKAGFFQLDNMKPDSRLLLSSFWQAAFLHFNAHPELGNIHAQSANLAANAPYIASAMKATMETLFIRIAQNRKKLAPLGADFWHGTPNHSRLFAGHIHMSLQNANYSDAEYIRILTRIEELRETLAAS